MRRGRGEEARRLLLNGWSSAENETNTLKKGKQVISVLLSVTLHISCNSSVTFFPPQSPSASLCVNGV